MLKDIAGYDVVCATLRHATVFHDDEIIRIELDRLGASPKMRIDVLAGSIHPRQMYTVVMIFHGLDDVSVSDFNHQNVIKEMGVEEIENRLTVRLLGIFGAELSFTCKEGTMDVGMSVTL